VSARISIEPALRRRVDPRVARALARIVGRAAARLGLRRHGAGVGVHLVGDATMIELHRRHMGSAEPTDVLSFPAIDVPGALAEGAASAGDIAIDWDQLVRQASGQGPAAWLAEAAQLIVHGHAHLAGHDHDVRARARRMLRAERRAARTAGLPEPQRPYAAGGRR
jgi:probable rRNA maturation factor